MSDAIALREGTFRFRDRKAIAEKSAEERKAKEQHFREKSKLAAENESHNILMVKNLPSQVTEEILSDLFSQYPGYK
jgi:RNA recognition motif-containing protein